MYKQKIHITSLDVDSNLELKVSSLFKLLQLVGSNHVAELKAGHLDLMKYNMLWVVIRMDVKIYRTPKLEEDLLFTTHPGENKSFIFPRYFEIYDKKGELVISVSSLWALIDATTRRVVLKPDGFVKIKAEKDKNDLPDPTKIVGDASNLVNTHKVRYTDIDLNGHFNNTSYIECILNTHENDFYKKHRLSSISINYDREIRDGETIELFSNGNIPEIIKGKVGGENRFTAQIEYEER